MSRRPSVRRRAAGPSSECARFGLELAAASDQPTLLAAPVRAHLDSCLRCQAELATYRKLRRSMGDLRPLTLEVPSLQVDEFLAAFGPVATIHALRRRSRRRAYVGGIAAAVTAAGAGAMMLAARLTTRSALAG
ncbi:MAG: hypothetical protein R2733_08045 [Acidimicrobiales bacterium]